LPNWKIHIEIGLKLNEYLKYDKEELNTFLLGSILPDINNGWMVPDVSVKLKHDATHLGIFGTQSYINLYDNYKHEFDDKNPLFIGYMAHVYTDYIWNRDFYTTITKSNLDLSDKDELRKLKQSDFKLYTNKYINNIIDINDIDGVLEEIQKINEISVAKDDVLKAIEFLKRENVYKSEYKFYTEQRLDELMDLTINGFVDILKEYKVI